MKVRIQIDTQTFVRFWLVVIGFAFAIIALYFAKTALIIVAVAAFFAIALNPPVSKLSHLIPGKSRIGATALAYVIVVALLGGLVFLVVPPIAEQTVKFIDQTPQAVQTISAEWSAVGDFVEQYNIQPQVDQAVESVRQNADEWLAGLGKNIVASIGSLFASIAAIFLILVLSFLMLLEGPSWMKAIWNLYSDKSKMKEHKHLVNKMVKVVSGYVNGQLTVSGVGAIFAGLTVFIISLFLPELPSNLAMPVIAITFVFSLIPMFGATVAGILSGLLLLFNSLPAAIIFGIYFIVYQQIENNFVSPTIQSKYIKLSPLTVLVAATIGLYMMGLLGGIVAIPIAGCIKVLIEYYLDESRAKSQPKTK